MQVFNRNVSVRGLTAFAFELVLIAGSMAFAVEMHGPLDAPVNTARQIAVVTALCLLCFYYNDLYDLTAVNSSRELVVRLLQAAGAAAIVLAFAAVTATSLFLDPSTLVTALGVFVMAVLTWRLAFNYFAADPHLQERVLIVGTGPSAQVLAREMAHQQDFGYQLVGMVDQSDDQALHRMIADRRIDRIVVGLADRRGRLPIDELLHAKLSGVRVEEATTTYERLTGKILLDDLKPSWLIFSDGFRASRITRFVKRIIDLSMSLIGFVLSAPLMALTALAIRLESDGPILYTQERIGENGRLFTVYKFRSMRIDAEHDGEPVWARDGDERITRVGRVIRVARLDELPQFWNVVRGDMSFVGPRPERPYFVDQLSRQIPFYQQRHAVKPGLTGWAQVKYQYGSSVEDAMEKLRYDLYYIKHMSIFFDLTIVLDTVKVILFGKGAK